MGSRTIGGGDSDVDDIRHPVCDLIFSQYGKSIPMELDESARIDGANPLQIYFQIYLPLMAPLVAVGTYALLLAWNEYLYNFLLLSTPASMTVAVALAQFLNSDESPWNYMMATAIIYSVPPIILYYGFRRHMVAGLTWAASKIADAARLFAWSHVPCEIMSDSTD